MRDRAPEAGTVELQSGPWSWYTRRAEVGTTVIFHHLQRRSDEMRAWTPARVVTLEEVEALAREPVLRLWTDSIGLQWTVSVELTRKPARNRGDRTVPATETRSLVFQRGGVRRYSELEPGATLGDLSRAELQRRFDSI